MKKIAPAFLLLASFMAGTAVNAQNDKKDKKETEEIVIRKNGDKKMDLTVEINGDKVTVNGKPLAEFKDNDISINKRKIIIRDGNDAMTFSFDKDFAEAWKDKAKQYKHRAEEYKDLMHEWQDGNMTSKAFLGVSTDDAENGAEIKQVTKESAAEKAGLQVGDIITKVGDEKVNNPASLSKIITAYKPKDKVKIYFTRNGKEKNATATLGESKQSRSMAFAFKSPDGDVHSFSIPPIPPVPPTPGMEWSEDEFKDLPRAFSAPKNFDFSFSRRQKLGLKIQDTEDGDQVKIIDVEKDSPADKAGLQKDDLLTEINGQKINSTDDAREQLRETQDKSSYTIKAKRNGTEKSFDIKIPRKLKTADL